jgi:putative ABC transport system substrate-binding protein
MIRFHKKILFFIIFTLFFATILPSEVISETPKKYKIVLLLWRGLTEAEKGFMDYFKERNLSVEFIIKSADKEYEKLKKLVKEIKLEKADLIYCFGTTTALAVAGRYYDYDNSINITDVPVVFCIVSNPVHAQIVKENKDHRKNITGVIHLVPFERQIEAMKKFIKFEKIGIFYNPLEKNSLLTIEYFESMKEKLGYELIKVKSPINEEGLPDLNKIEESINKLVEKKPDIIYFPSDSIIVSNSSKILEIINNHKIPTFSATEPLIKSENGALTGLVSPYYSCGKYAAYKAEQILFKKIPAKDIPIETLPKFSYLINMKTSLKIKKYPSLELIKIGEIIE